MWITQVWKVKCGDVDKFVKIGYLKGFFTLVAHIFIHIRQFTNKLSTKNVDKLNCLCLPCIDKIFTQKESLWTAT